jgi:DNA replication protein DnaC
MSLAVVRNRIAEMGFQGMLPVIESAIERVQKGELHVTEALDLLLENEWRYRQERATATRKLRSKIRKGASLEEFDFTLNRGITKADLRNLAKLEWCEQGRPLIFVGPTGIGKSYLARALGMLACERGKTALFLSVTDFLENQAIARACNGYLKFRASLVRPDVLILDDLGMRKFSSQEAEDLRDVIEHRSYGKSTVITTQLPVDHWAEVIGDEIIRDALIDRLETPGQVIQLKGPSYRERLKPDAQEVDKKTARG